MFYLEQQRKTRWVRIDEFEEKEDAQNAAVDLAKYSGHKCRVVTTKVVSTYTP